MSVVVILYVHIGFQHHCEKLILPYSIDHSHMDKESERMSEIKIPEVLSKSDYLKLPPHERERYVREILRQTVNNNQYGVTVPLLSRSLPFDPRTIEKHLSVLTYTNEIYTVNVGPTTLYLPNSRVMHPVLEKMLKINSREYGVYVLKNRFGDFVFIQEKKKTEFIEEVGGGILIPLSDFGKFVDYLNEVVKQIHPLKEGAD